MVNQADRNPWQYCNADDPGVGFPRDCGPTVFVPSIWNALPSSKLFRYSRKHYRYSVVRKAGTTTTSITTTTITTTTQADTTKTSTTASETTITTTSSSMTTTTTSTTSSSYSTCGPGEKFIKRANKCEECPDGQFQSQESHRNSKCEYASVSCKFQEYIVAEATKSANLYVVVADCHLGTLYFSSSSF